MTDITGIITAFEQKDVISFVLSIIGGIVQVYLIFKEFRFLGDLRYRLRVIIGIGFFLTALLIWYWGWVSNTTFNILLSLWIIILILMYFSSKKILWPLSSIFDRIKVHIRHGEYDSALKMLEKYRWLCIDPLMHYEWVCLCAAVQSKIGNPRKSFEILRDFNIALLPENEKNSFTIAKADYYMQLGNYRGSISLISDLNEIEENLVLHKANIIAVCEEVRGNLVAASDTLLSALTSMESSTSDLLYITYNNLGRFREIEGNKSEMFLYYEKAALAASNTGNKHLIHTSNRNLLLQYAKEKMDEKEKELIDRYQTQIDNTNIYDLLEFHNSMREYYRQKSDGIKIISTIEKGRSEIYPKLTEHQKICFDISELRIRWNSQLLRPSFLAHIEQQFNKYLELDLTNRYVALKEINIVLNQLKAMNELEPFSSFHKIVQNHVKEIETEIEKYLLTLPEYCVNEKCVWLWELASIQKSYDSQYDHQNVLQRLRDLKDTLLKYGNYLEGLKKELDFSDEAMSQKRKDLVSQSVKQAIKDLDSFKGHPVEAECFIRIAFYAYYAEQPKCAEEYFFKFEKTGVSINNFANWIQTYYYSLFDRFVLNQPS